MDTGPGRWIVGDADSVAADLDSVPASWLDRLVPVTSHDDPRAGWVSWHRIEAGDDAVTRRLLQAMRSARQLPDDRLLLGSTLVLVNASFVAPILALALLDRPVVRLRPDRTAALVSAAGNTKALAVGPHPEISSGIDPPGTAAQLSITEYATPLIESVRRLTRLPRRAAWALVASVATETIIDLGRDLGDESRAAALIDDLLAPGSMLALAPPTRHSVTVDGVDHLWSCRSVCCLYYKARDYCTTVCPLVSEEERRDAIADLIRTR
ncbi:(2Fe-2S)-binding protein [Desertimonas flava]|uniref:(2Fe-2S)-binding protein n=1 Tax=Desertimonas flava TaxID=2064846 RepID=UPI000E34A23E|nr:(2Fe-2S)-binding protein [Desertimonas flava]